jgi:hypothetical protein
LLPIAVSSVAFRCINFIIQIAQDACAQLQDAVRTGCFRLVLETQEEQTIVNGIAKVGFLAFLVCFLDSQKGQAVCLRIEALLAIGADDCALPNTTSYVKREERACRTKISLVCAGASLHLILQHKLEVRVDQVNPLSVVQVTKTLESAPLWFCPLPCSLKRSCSAISGQRPPATSVASHFALTSLIQGQVAWMAARVAWMTDCSSATGVGAAL